MKKRLMNGLPIVLGVLLLLVGLFHGADAIDCKGLTNEKAGVILEQCKGQTDISPDKNFGTRTYFDVKDLTDEQLLKLPEFLASISGNFEIDFIMKDISTVTTLSFTNIKGFKASLILENNKGLQTIEGSNVNYRGTVKARGNPQLSKDSIAYLRSRIVKIQYLDLQEFNECVQDPADSDGLKGCEHIYKDLTLTDFSQFTNPFYPKTISGCLTLKKTKTEPKEIDISDFLKEFVTGVGQANNCTTGSSIDGYCMKNEFQEKIKAAVKPSSIVIKTPANCLYTCSPEDIFSHGQKGCKQVNGRLEVTSKATDAQLDLLRDVVEVHGQVIIKDFGGEKELDFFSNLQIINSNHATEPALVIKNNKKGKGMNFNSLQTISSPHSKPFVFEGNGFFCNDIQLLIFGKALGKEHGYEVGCDENSQKTTTQKPAESEEKKSSSGVPLWAAIVFKITVSTSFI